LQGLTHTLNAYGAQTLQLQLSSCLYPYST